MDIESEDLLSGKSASTRQPTVAKEKRREFCQTTGKNTTSGGAQGYPNIIRDNGQRGARSASLENGASPYSLEVKGGRVLGMYAEN